MTVQFDKQDCIFDQRVSCFALDLDYTTKKVTEDVPVLDAKGQPVLNRRGEIVYEEIETVKNFIKNHLTNCMDFLLNHRKYAGRIRYNSWFNIVEYKEKLYGEEESWKFLQDEMELEIAYWIGKHYNVHFKSDMMHRAILTVAKRNPHNPFWDMMMDLPKTTSTHIEEMRERNNGYTDLELMLERYFGVLPIVDQDGNDTGLQRNISKRWMIGTLKRALKTTVEDPIKHEAILVLYGEQAIGKSTAICTMCINRAFFGDNSFDIKNKDTPQRLQGKFIYELKELANRRRAEAEKAFFDNQVDECRLPWGKNFTKFPRRVSFIATTNRPDILNDSTGSRRWLPVRCGMQWKRHPTKAEKRDKTRDPKTYTGEYVIDERGQRVAERWPTGKMIDEKALADAMPALWAEALYWIEKGEQHWLNPNEELLRMEHNKDYESVHPLTDDVAEKAKDMSLVTVKGIMDLLDWDKTRRDHKSRATIEMILTSLGYRKVRRRPKGYETQKRFWVKE